jgi:NhaA family Na+:H+ antiporter
MNTPPITSTNRPFYHFRKFLQTESAGGVVLVVFSIASLVWVNSPFKSSFYSFWESRFDFSLGSFSFGMDFHHWVNEGFMTFFFFVIGLEIKREVTSGHLSTRKSITLPLFGAVGGMVVPALTYLLIAGSVEPRGWGIPMATDIALAVGVLSLLGSRVSPAIRAFLLGLAVVDDIGAILVIAIFYSTNVSAKWLLVALIVLVFTAVLKRLDVRMMWVYLLCGVVVWYSLYKTGVHPTLAGVIFGLLTPTFPHKRIADLETEDSVSVLEWLEHLIHPWTSFVIVPLFALANAGIEISFQSLSDASTSAIAWGIFIGLVVGKPVGIVLTVVMSKRLKLADIPRGASMKTFLGVGNAAGIGFTVALFISELAFTDATHRADAKIAILLGSLVSAALSVAVLMTQSKVEGQRARGS